MSPFCFHFTHIKPIAFIPPTHTEEKERKKVRMANASNPTVHVPPLSLIINDPMDEIFFQNHSFTTNGGIVRDHHEALTALRRYLPSNKEESKIEETYGSDEFRMYEFKVRRCARARSHDWTECPYSHPGEKARRRDPRKFHYSGTPCPDFRKGNCKRGDTCDYAHGVFECWLHPARYRTQPCKDGTSCLRRICFFAHTPHQLRLLTPTTQHPTPYDSPVRNGYDSFFSKGGSVMLCSPTSTLMSPHFSSPSDSPPVSPSSMNEMMFSMRNLELGESRSVPWNVQYFFSGEEEEEPVMERVESGRSLRAKIFEKLSKENSLGRVFYSPDSDTV